MEKDNSGRRKRRSTKGRRDWTLWVGGGGKCLVKNECFCLRLVYQISTDQPFLQRNAICCNVELISDMC